MYSHAVHSVLDIIHRSIMEHVVLSFVVVETFLAGDRSEKVGADCTVIIISTEIFLLELFQLILAVDRVLLLGFVNLYVAENIQLGNI